MRLRCVVLAMGLAGCGSAPVVPPTHELADGGMVEPAGAADQPGTSGPAGAMGPTGATGPMGAMGPTGATGATGAGLANLYDAQGRLLGTPTMVVATQVTYRDPQGLLWNIVAFDPLSGEIQTNAALNGPSVWYAAADCSGAPYAQTMLRGQAVVLNGMLYKTTGDLTSVMAQSSTGAGATACDAVNGTPSAMNLMPLTLVGPAPPAVALPVELR